MGINYVISKANFHRVYEAAKLVKELGADNIKFAAVISNEDGYHSDIKDEVVEQIKHAKEDIEDKSFQIINNYEKDCEDNRRKEVLVEHCFTCRLVTVIAADCKLYTCHTRAYDEKAIIGDIKDKHFKEVWFSEETQKKLRMIDPLNECNNFCVYEDRNRLIEDFFRANKHINFI